MKRMVNAIICQDASNNDLRSGALAPDLLAGLRRERINPHRDDLAGSSRAGWPNAIAYIVVPS